ncbi:MAG: DNA/RNA nuclease SfsA, partial [Clostridia bacterium]|nr:DNA/RNA nuclease SfsA [Clostridia bacterium]
EGYRAYALFVIQMAGMKVFRPNDERHAAFGAALREAADNGVTVLAIGCDVTPDSLVLSEAVHIDLA